MAKTEKYNKLDIEFGIKRDHEREDKINEQIKILKEKQEKDLHQQNIENIVNNFHQLIEKKNYTHNNYQKKSKKEKKEDKIYTPFPEDKYIHFCIKNNTATNYRYNKENPKKPLCITKIDCHEKIIEEKNQEKICYCGFMKKIYEIE